MLCNKSRRFYESNRLLISYYSMIFIALQRLTSYDLIIIHYSCSLVVLSSVNNCFYYHYFDVTRLYRQFFQFLFSQFLLNNSIYLDEYIVVSYIIKNSLIGHRNLHSLDLTDFHGSKL